MKPLAAFGKYKEIPRAGLEKRISKLLTKVGSKSDMGPKLDELPDVVRVHAGDATAKAPIAIAAKSEIIVVEGDVDCPSLSLDADETTLVVIAGTLRTELLRIAFPATLVVEGSLVADYIVHDTASGLVVLESAVMQKIFLFGDYLKPKIGKQAKGTIVTCEEHAVIRDVEAHVLWKRMLTGKRFLFDA